MCAGLACRHEHDHCSERDNPTHGWRSLDCVGCQAPVAHRIERSAPDRKAAGSIPARRTTYASRPKITSPRGAPWSYICAVQLPPSGPPEAQPPPSMQPYATPQPAAYYIAPTDGGAVWALVLGVLGF